MKSKIALFVTMLMLSFIVSGCRTKTPETPESIATIVVESLLEGDVEQAKMFATDDLLRIIGSDDLLNALPHANLNEDVLIEFDHVSDLSYDGTIKNVHFIIKDKNRICRLRITMIDDNGKWLFNDIQCR